MSKTSSSWLPSPLDFRSRSMRNIRWERTLSSLSRYDCGACFRNTRRRFSSVGLSLLDFFLGLCAAENPYRSSLSPSAHATLLLSVFLAPDGHSPKLVTCPRALTTEKVDAFRFRLGLGLTVSPADFLTTGALDGTVYDMDATSHLRNKCLDINWVVRNNLSQWQQGQILTAKEMFTINVNSGRI